MVLNKDFKEFIQLLNTHNVSICRKKDQKDNNMGALC